MDAPRASLAGGRFHDLVRIGAGAFGTVYRAFDGELQRPVALKILHEQDAAQRMLLKREFRTLRTIPHPNVVRFHELLVEDDALFYTMDLVDGRPIDTWWEASRDLAALEQRTRELVAAVQAIHAHGAIHRDIKPANLLVDVQDRLVVVDFGFATLAVPRRAWDGGERSGTWAYMAPEALLGDVVPASDWYSVGVVLHELVAGALPPPFAQPGVIAATLSRHGDAAPWLPQLVNGLLSDTPDDRETAVARFMQSVVATNDGAGHRATRELVGRDAEIERLRRAFEASRGGPIVCVVRGLSGIGKSALLRAVVDDVASAGAVILESRCHTTERVPYNALDGLVDDLARYLVATGAADIASPEALAAAATLFPVLRNVPGFSADSDGGAGLPPHRLRRTAVMGLRGALSRAAAAAPLVLCLEDVHWGDADSAALLDDLLAPPRIPLLLLLSHQWPDIAPGPFLATLQLDGVERTTITLGPLDDDTVRAWLRRPSGATLGPDATEYVVSQADGHPFLVQELARAVAAAPEHAGGAAVRLEDLLASRLGLLEEDERAFLEAAALAGHPTHCDALAVAAGLRGAGKSRAEYLAAQNFLALRRAGDGMTAAIYHEQTRRALTARMSEARRRQLHLRLAESLEQHAPSSGESEPIFVHYLGAGREERAAHFAERAGREAASALAFARAGRLLREAVALSTNATDRVHRTAALATALAGDGRALDAARAFERAARLAAQLDGGANDVPQWLALAASHLARGGRHDESHALLSELLGPIGVRLPRPDEARPRWRPWTRRAHPVPTSADDGRLWQACTTLLLSEPGLARWLIAEHARRARGLRDEASASRAIALDHVTDAGRDGKTVDRALARAVAAATADAPHAIRLSVALCDGIRLAEQADWSASLRRLEEVGDGVTRDAAADVVVARLHELRVLLSQGRFAVIAERRQARIADALASGDERAACLFRAGEPLLAHLAADDVATVRRELATATACVVGVPSTALRVRLVVADVLTLLYEHRPEQARERLLGDWNVLERCGALALPDVAVLYHRLRAHTALALTATASLLSDAKRSVRILRASRDRTALPYAVQIDAALARARGDRAGALERSADAAARFRACDMPLHAAACELRMMRPEARSRAEATLCEARVVDPDRFAAVVVP